MELVTVPELVAWGKGQVQNDEATQAVVAAVNAFVSQLPVAAGLTAGEGGTVTGPGAEAVKLGALMLANRVHRRRNSPNGIEAMTGDAIAFTARFDPDVSRFLRLDAPVVG